jgi:hypothetical protein
MEILMSKGQIYEMTTTRTRTGSMRENPLPVLRINGNIRFRKSDCRLIMLGYGLLGGFLLMSGEHSLVGAMW